MFTTAPGSVERHLEYLEGWLIQIARHTQDTRDAVSGRAGAGPAGGARPGGDQGFLDRLEKRLEGVIGGAIAQGLGRANALAQRGLGGTIEGARHDFAMEQLGKQFAAVMLPVLQAGTYMAEQIESRMRRMGGREQNGLMGTLVGAGLGYRFGGLPGAVLGGTVGAMAMGGAGGSEESGYMGAAAGAFVGLRYGGPVGAMLGAGAGYVAGRGDYGSMRARGNSEITSGLGAAAVGAADWMEKMSGAQWLGRQLNGESWVDSFRRRNVEPSGGGIVSMLMAGVRTAMGTVARPPIRAGT